MSELPPILTPMEIREWVADLRTQAAKLAVEQSRAVEGIIHSQTLLAIARGRVVHPQRCAKEALDTYTVAFERWKAPDAPTAPADPPCSEPTFE